MVEFHYRWEWKLQSSPEALWPLVSNTNRFNRDTSVPSIENLDAGQDLNPSARRHLKMHRLNFFGLKFVPIEWVEEPFQWVQPYVFGVMRNYLAGPVESMNVLAQLIPNDDGGTTAIYEVWAKPKNLLGLAAIPFQIGFLSARDFRRAFAEYDQLAAAQRLPLVLHAHPDFAPNGRERLERLRQQLRTQSGYPEVIDQLADLVLTADDMSLAHMRPYALADYWKLPRRAVLEACLLATRAGMLNLRWDLLCPLCRGAKMSGDTLGDIRSTVHCDTCNIDFTVNFDRSVELTFRPNPTIRHLDGLEFCIAGPQITPHVVIQQLLPAGAERTATPILQPGRYRARVQGKPGGQYFLAGAGGARNFTLESSRWGDDEPVIDTQPTLTLRNTTESEQLLIIERMAWSDQAVTAAEVTSLQLFRDLFAREALRPGEQISVGSITVLFTDLCNSTQLYRDIGDAPAFGLVMRHFDVLREAIDEEDGAMVKTIGDAVMAVFRRPVNAMRAVVKAQMRLDQQGDLVLKAGIHTGPSIAVTLNERLDYFGSMVNMAARLQGLSVGRDVVISQEVRHDPEVSMMLNTRGTGLQAERFETVLKGFEGERFELWRISAARPVETQETQSAAGSPER